VQAGEVDILILPEMAFTGYVFKSPQEVEPFAEDELSGFTVSWAKTQGETSCPLPLKPLKPLWLDLGSFFIHFCSFFCSFFF